MTIVLVDIAAYVTAGASAGMLYFGGLWWNVRLFAQRRRTGIGIVLLLARIAVLAGVLTVAARAGAMPLLLMALGVFIGRFVVMRRLRAIAP